MSDERPQRPLDNDDRDAWKAYWTVLSMPWRTEPEIDEERQQYLAQRCAVVPDISSGIYPFRNENGGIKLSRADVEWLLATHESGGMRGSVDWNDARQRKRDGLDLRGADLRRANLRDLPLTGMRGGLRTLERVNTTPDQRRMAGVQLTGADVSSAHLERANLGWAHLEGANLFKAQLHESFLYSARLESANLVAAQMQGSILRYAFLDSSSFVGKIVLSDSKHGPAQLGGVHWGGTDLTVVEWRQLRLIGEEHDARQAVFTTGKKKARSIRFEQFERAVRANRQLATALREQGLNEDADRFAYRAQVLQREVLRRQGQLGRAFGSWLLDVVSGYGYKPMQSIITYIAVVLGFAAAYFGVTNVGITPFLPTGSKPLAWYEALVLSISSFHGRGLFPSALTLGDPITILAAVEAIIGLLIEITFIATFTQRFFAR